MTAAQNDNPSTDQSENAVSRVVLITGMSGAGKTTALKALEDLDFEAIDNIPLSLLENLVIGNQPQFHAPGFKKPVVIGVDIRTRDFGIDAFLNRYDALSAQGDVEAAIVFVDCEDEELARRYDETRHRHPLAIDRPVVDGIAHERKLLEPLRERADLVVDTTGMAPGELKQILQAGLQFSPNPELAIFVTSFAYRQGVPRSADLVFDVRFLKNPHYENALKPLTGLEPKVGDFIEADSIFSEYFENLTGLLEPLFPRYLEEGKSYLTIAIGCTGGRHRSVYVAEKLAQWIEKSGRKAQIHHRELQARP